MRIEAFNQVQQLYNSNKTTKNQKTDKLAFTDQLQISSIGKDIQTAKQAVIQSPDIRENVLGLRCRKCHGFTPRKISGRGAELERLYVKHSLLEGFVETKY